MTHTATPIIGIDLGTTNSLVAYADRGVPTIIPDPETGEPLLPSVVYFPSDPANPPLVGKEGLAHLAHEPAQTIYSAKRLMGKGLADVQNEAMALPYALSPDHAEAVRIQLGDGRVVAPPEVGAIVLRELKRRAEAHLKMMVEKAVVTVPAYFNDAERQATKDAGRIAGLEIVRIVNEPTAASLAYGLQNRQTATIAVYDLGGGTFDISLLRLEDGLFEVLATGGDTRLGGDDMDAALVDWLLAEADITGDTTAMLRGQARVAAEAAKIHLTDYATADIELPLPNGESNGNGTLRRTITRAQFDVLIAPIVDRTVAACRRVLADAGLTQSDVDEVVLVGGATRVPSVRQAVQEFWGRVPHTELDPDAVVALGAAVQADILSGQRTDLLLLDVTPLSLGLETMGGAVERLIYRNSKIPSSAREEFTTSVDGQQAVLLHVVQGEREMATDNRSLARLELTNLPPMPAGLPRIEVQFLLDANGILQVSAREARSGATANVRIKPSYGLEETEVRRMVRESFVFADTDFQARMLADMRNEADSAILGATKLLRDYGNAITADERQAIETALSTLRQARESEHDHNTIRARMDELDRVGQPLAQTAMSGVAQALVGGKTLDEALHALDGNAGEK